MYFGMKLYIFRTVRLSIIRSSFTVHSAMVYAIQVCRQLSSGNRMELVLHVVGFITKKCCKYIQCIAGVSENIIDWESVVGDRCRVLVLNMREEDHLEDLSVGGRVIL